MNDHDEIFQSVCHYAELVESREADLGAYAGDGLTTEQALLLVESLRPLIDSPNSLELADVWNAFRKSIEAEMSWKFPERDPIGAALTPALRHIQEFTGLALEDTDPAWKQRIEEYTNLHRLKNAAERQVALRGNRISWRIAMARVMNKLGAKELAASVAGREVERWQK